LLYSDPLSSVRVRETNYACLAKLWCRDFLWRKYTNTDAYWPLPPPQSLKILSTLTLNTYSPSAVNAANFCGYWVSNHLHLSIPISIFLVFSKSFPQTYNYFQPHRVENVVNKTALGEELLYITMCSFWSSFNYLQTNQRSNFTDCLQV
jgi:hypothetical protein